MAALRNYDHWSPSPAYLKRGRLDMRVSDQVLKCVVFLGVKPEGGDFKPKATAFIVGINQETFAFQYLVTAEHCVKRILAMGAAIWIRINNKDGSVVEEEVKSDFWTFHPKREDGGFDIAILPYLITPTEDVLAIPLNSEDSFRHLQM